MFDPTERLSSLRALDVERIPPGRFLVGNYPFFSSFSKARIAALPSLVYGFYMASDGFSCLVIQQPVTVNSPKSMVSVTLLS